MLPAYHAKPGSGDNVSDSGRVTLGDLPVFYRRRDVSSGDAGWERKIFIYLKGVVE